MEIRPVQVPVAVTASQVRRPWRTTLRTMLQTAIPTLIALGVVVPEIVGVMLDEMGESAPSWLRAALLGVAAAIVAAAAITTRIMAIPAVEAFLRSRGFVLSGLAAEPAESVKVNAFATTTADPGSKVVVGEIADRDESPPGRRRRK